jgi:hypothetical protein
MGKSNPIYASSIFGVSEEEKVQKPVGNMPFHR